MPHTFAVRALALAPTDTLPGRFGEGGLRELVEALDGTVGDDEDVWVALRRTFEALPFQELSERLLDLVLLQPPIPAGCEALVRAMQDPERPPWRTHEVAEDRVWLWYCQRLLHRAMPERFPAPTALHLTLEVVQLDPDGRPPGARSGAHERTGFVARLLAARPGDNPLGGAHAGDAWAYDTVWAAEVGARRKATAEELIAAGGAPAGAGACLVVQLEAWVPDTSTGDLAADATWRAEA